MAYDSTADLYKDTPVDGPGRHAWAVTPSDAADFTHYPRMLYVGVSGDVSLVPLLKSDDGPVVFKNHPVGYLRCRCRRVMATGTTATNILALT